MRKRGKQPGEKPGRIDGRGGSWGNGVVPALTPRVATGQALQGQITAPGCAMLLERAD